MTDDDWKGEHLIRGQRYSHAGHQGSRYVTERAAAIAEDQRQADGDRPHKPWSAR